MFYSHEGKLSFLHHLPQALSSASTASHHDARNSWAHLPQPEIVLTSQKHGVATIW